MGAPHSTNNPKGHLQELLQGQGCPTPAYRETERKGPDHRPTFAVEVVVGEKVIGAGQGRKKAEAERAAAEDALRRLTVVPPEPEFP